MPVWSWQGHYSTTREPKPSRKVLAAIPLIKAALDANEEWGACHIVLSDINIEKYHVRWCRERPEITPAGAAAMDAMLSMTMRERAIALCAVEEGSFYKWSDEEWAQLDHDH